MKFPIYPSSYSHWLSARLTISRHETLATCDNCAMVKPEGLTRDQGPFLNHLKCCTYFPFIPNFSLMAIGESKIAKTSARSILLPVGFFPSPAEQKIIARFGIDGFGRRSELLCPFFDSKGNQCSIWSHRPGVCTSYFCKSNLGQKGLDFWKNVESYLNHFEWKLACEVMRRVGLTENELAYCEGALSPETENEEIDFFINAAWGGWQNRKFEFYAEADRQARLILPKELNDLLDPEFIELENKINSLKEGLEGL